MSDVNEQVGGGNEPVVKASNEAISFEAMDELMNSKPETPADKALKVDKNDRASSKRGGEEEDGKKKAGEDSEDEDQDPADKKAAAAKKGKDGKDDADAAGKPKVIKMKNGDADLDVPANAKITVKIGGKDETFDLQEVVNEFSGKTHWNRKWQELDTEKKTFHAERTELQSGIDTLYDLAVTKNQPMDAIALLAEMLGGDGVKTVQDLQAKMMGEFEALAKLTPEQKAAKQEKDRADLLERKLNNRKAADAKKSSTEAIAKRVDAIKQKHGISDERFNELYEQLGKTTKAEDLTPEFIGMVHERWVQMDQVDEVITEMTPENPEAVRALLLGEWKKDPTLTKEQIAEIGRQVFGGKKSKSSLKEKMAKNNGGSSATSVSKTAGKKSEALTFDDLE